MNERREYTDEERYIIAVLRHRNNIPDTVSDEEVLPPLDEHIEYKREEFRFGFSFPWRYIGSVLQEKIINYERQLAGDDILNEMPDVCYTELFDEFKGDLCILDWTIAREIADRYGLWGAYPPSQRPEGW